MANATAGTAQLAVNGQTYLVTGDFKYSVSQVSRETLVGIDQVHGFKRTPVAGFISATLRNTDTLNVAALNAMENVNITVSLANGKTVIGYAMWAVDAQEVDGAEGTIPVRWEGVQVIEA